MSIDETHEALFPHGPLEDARSERERAENIAGAVANARVIGMAMGILQMTENLDEPGAFKRLSTVSQNRNVPLREVAAEVVRRRGLTG